MRLRAGLAHGEEWGERMHFGFRGTALAFAITTVLIGSTAARAGDDGSAPLWVGIGSIFSGLGVNPFGREEKPPPIDYREHGKIVVPPKTDLPPPGSPVATGGEDWPVNVETQRKAAQKEAAKKDIIAGQGDARLRYTHPFPNAPVTVRASDQADPALTCPHGKCESTTNSSSMLGSINPLNWVGMGKSTALGPEPDREWLTDPPKGYRAPVAATGQAAN
jgi:hypothetical protein